jgi:hypothetical protein
MPIHWSYKSLPELAALSDAERKDVWKKANWQAYEQWQTWLATAIVFALMVFLGRWLGSTFGHDFIGMIAGGVLASAMLIGSCFELRDRASRGLSRALTRAKAAAAPSPRVS